MFYIEFFSSCYILLYSHSYNIKNLELLFNDKTISTISDKHFKASYVLGISSLDKICTFKESQLKENIEKFRNDPKCKILCATNVVEEGIDVPDCNNVINLNEMRTIKEYFITTINH